MQKPSSASNMQILYSLQPGTTLSSWSTQDWWNWRGLSSGHGNHEKWVSKHHWCPPELLRLNDTWNYWRSTSNEQLELQKKNYHTWTGCKPWSETCLLKDLCVRKYINDQRWGNPSPGLYSGPRNKEIRNLMSQSMDSGLMDKYYTEIQQEKWQWGMIWVKHR